jgi:hypothetical protein
VIAPRRGMGLPRSVVYPIRRGNVIVMRRGMGQSYTPATNVQQAAAQIAQGEAAGGALYQMNLAAAKTQPGFNQAQFDAWWNCQTQGGFGAAQEGQCPEPTFVAYAGTAVSNQPAVLPANVVPAIGTVPPTKAATAPPKHPAQTSNQPVAQSNAPAPTVVTGGGTTQSNAPGQTSIFPSTWMTTTTVGSIPNWLLLAGAGGLALLFFMGGKK